MRPVKLGVIGCGAMGCRHIVAGQASPLINVVAVADPVVERARELATSQGIAQVYREGAELLADENVEAVVLALPTVLRSPLARQAFQAGKHVLLEKPAAMNAADLEEILALQGDRVGASCSSRYRLLPSARAVTEFLRDQPLGPLRSLVVREFQPAKPRPEKEKPAWRLSRTLNGGGVLVNWGCYDLDYILGLTGWQFEPQSVLAQTWPISPDLAAHIPESSDAETHCSALVRSREGSVLRFDRGEYMPLSGQPAWEIIGTRGSLRLQLRPGQSKTIHHDFLDKETGFQTRILWEGNEDGSALTEAPLLDFASAIREGHPPATSLHDALRLQKIVDGIYASAECGGPIQIAGNPTAKV